MRGHRDKKSAIYKHFFADHLTPMYPIPKFESDFKVLCKIYQDIVKIMLAEALLIRMLNPHISVKFNEMSIFLNLHVEHSKLICLMCVNLPYLFK